MVEPTVTATSLVYRCVCGQQVAFQGLEKTACPNCGRRINPMALDATQTLSFCTALTPASDLTSHPNSDRSGEQLGHFLLESKLGQGGMGAVYRALDKSLRRYVAVKVIRCGNTSGSSTDRVSKLLDEAVAQARVNHPNVVTIYFVGCESDEPFFAMELLPGPTLDAVVRDGPLPFKQVISYSRQVVSALADASRLGIVHGDIKPSNLILTSNKSIKLGDFGLAQTEDSAPSNGLSGTLSYLAPELIDGHSATEQSDMYALGVTLFELTFGRRPHSVQGPTLSAQLLSQRAAEIDFPERWPDGVPVRWRAVLEKLLEKDPSQRYATYEQLDRDLQALTPVGYTRGGLISRGLAYMVDIALQLLVLLPLMVPTMMVEPVEDARLAKPGIPLALYIMLGLLPPLVPLLMAWYEWKGWRTPGRYLFQLRVVDRHGLPLTRRNRMLRGLMRNAPIWIAALFAFPIALGTGPISMFIGFLDELFVLVNMLPVLGPRRLALHDRVTRSHVVLDTRGAQVTSPFP